MSTLAIFIVGLMVTSITMTAVILIGLSEAADPAHSRLRDLSRLERHLVDRSEEAETDTTADSR